MPKMLCAVLVAGLLAVPSRADDAEARAIIAKSIAAMGGEAYLGKFKATTSKMKGEINMMGMKIPFTGDVATQKDNQQRIIIDVEVMGMKFNVTEVLDKDKGWVKIGNDVMDMNKDKLAETLEQAHAGWVSSLVPLKDKAYTLSTLGDVQVEGMPALGVRVSYQGRRDVSLFFDKKSHLLVKTETRAKDETTGQEVTDETFFSDYQGNEAKMALKLSIKRDGKPFIDAQLSDIKLEEKLDDSVFAKP